MQPAQKARLAALSQYAIRYFSLPFKIFLTLPWNSLALGLVVFAGRKPGANANHLGFGPAMAMSRPGRALLLGLGLRWECPDLTIS